MGIDATVRAAADWGFRRCRLARDACVAKALSFNGADVPAAQVHAAFLAALQGLYAEVASAEEMVSVLASDWGMSQAAAGRPQRPCRN